MADHLIKPHGDDLIYLLLDEDRDELRGLIEDLTSISDPHEEPSDQIPVFRQHIGYLTGSQDN